MSMDFKNKNTVLGGGVILLLVALLLVVVLSRGNNKPAVTSEKQTNPTEQTAIPTVDTSVKVDLLPRDGKKEMTLTIKGMPTKTQSIDYELSYLTKQQGLQGIIGTITLQTAESEYEKQLTLGTCSSGKCVYHEVVGKIKVTLKFSGEYGEKLFDKEFDL